MIGKRTNKKLTLKKSTVVQLDKVKMNSVHGGEEPPVTSDTCRRRLITSW